MTKTPPPQTEPKNPSEEGGTSVAESSTNTVSDVTTIVPQTEQPCNCGMGCNPMHPPCEDYKPQTEQIDEIIDDFHRGLVNFPKEYAKYTQEAKSKLQALLTASNREAVNSPHFQIAIRQQNTKQKLWALTIAQYGKQVYGDVFRTEEEARDKLPEVLAELKRLGEK